MIKKTLYLECYAGISGDMTVAALLDLGADKEVLMEAVDSIRPMVRGFEIEIKRVQKAGIDACDFHVILDKEHENYDHDMNYLHGDIAAQAHGANAHYYAHDDNGSSQAHEHDSSDHEHSSSQAHEHDSSDHEHSSQVHEYQVYNHDGSHHHHDHHDHTGVREITEILGQAKITDNARTLALHIFQILAEAEAKAHNKPIEEVHFHEVGAVDSIVDIMAAAVCMDSLCKKFGVDAVVFSPLYEGHGTVRCQHGILPVPVPAVANILETHGMQVRFMEVQGEFVTPTGAAIAAAFRTTDKLPEQFRIAGMGIGAGKRSYERPSLLRAMLLEEECTKSDTIYKLESNIDDCTGEALGYVMERLFEFGAKDVHYTPVFMKKDRPAYQLNVICAQEDISRLEKLIFDETTTIGIRRVKMERSVLEREAGVVDTSIGKVSVKICGDRVYPEYNSLSALCREKQIAYQEAYYIVMGEINAWKHTTKLIQ